MDNTNYLSEAEKILKLIDVNKLDRREDISFVLSMKSRVKYNNSIGQKEVFWLRDIKDRQLEK